MIAKNSDARRLYNQRLKLERDERARRLQALNRALALDRQGQARLVLTEELIGTLKFDASATDVSVPTDLLGTITDDGSSVTWTEGGNSASDTEFITVDGRLKLGNFALSFTDLEVPVAGIPITIRRTYDTLDAEKNGDFGYGWNLEVSHPTVNLVPGTQGRYPARVAGRSYPSMENGTEVIVTTPEGTEERFRFQWVEVGFGFWSNTNQFRPSFVPVGNNNYQLIAPGSGELFNQFYMNTDGSGYDYSPFAPYYGGFELKEIGRGTRGLTYQIFSDGETAKSVSDKYGNTLTYDTNQAGQIVGISSNRGRAVTINRDWSGRISTITDPAGHSLTYKYDSLGRLVSFYDRRATARLHDEDPTNDYQPTKFQYTLGTNPAFENIPGVENYLTRIIDPLGIDALRANYDPTSGRLVSLVDADGNPASLSYDIAGLKVTSTSSSGTTQVSLDPSGNPIRSVDEQGNVTLTEYADPIKGLPSRITRVIGQPDTPTQIAAGTGDDLTTRYTYNQWGQRTSETDPRGNTSTTVYDNQGYPRQEIDRFGNVTTYAFFDGQLYGTTDTDGNGNQRGRKSKGSGLFDVAVGCDMLGFSHLGDYCTCPDHPAPTKREGFTTP